jgi:adenylosuccinate lyase
VGTLAFSSPSRERKVLESVGLKEEPCATQVVARDRFAWFFATLGVTASCLEHIALNIRHYHRTEVSEVLEGFGRGQKGSSAMPHKRNPVDCENVCGLARLVRSYCLPAMEDVALWHERDISHSSVERVIGPDATSLLEFATLRLSNIIQNLEIRKERMREHLGLTNGGIFSEAVLLALVKKGLMRQKAYELVQKASLFEGGSKHLLDKVMENKEIRALLTEEEIKRCFDDKEYLRHVDAIFARSLEKA